MAKSKKRIGRIDKSIKLKPSVKLSSKAIDKSIRKLNIKPTIKGDKLAESINFIRKKNVKSLRDLSSDVRASHKLLKGKIKRFHGAKASLSWFPSRFSSSRCRNRFGYMTRSHVRSSSKLSFNSTSMALLNQLGDLMGNSGREIGIGDSTLPAGYTYFGQFVDHDITFDVSSSINTTNNANTIDNMRSPKLDLDSLYGDGPALHPYLYDFPTSSFNTAIKFKLGVNTNVGPGGPGGAAGPGGMVAQTDFDVPRIPGSNTAVIGDPRNDENLIVSQFHHCMLKFHNAVVDQLMLASFGGDIFEEAKRIVTHHYQWAVVEDFLKRICGPAAVNDALANVSIRVGQSFRMPVEFSVAAYRFGHSLIRDDYWLNFNFINQPLSDVFSFVRNPNLPVFSNWVIDFNAFFDTGIPVPVFNQARKIDSVLSNGLETLPGASGIMAILATMNLRRGLAFGLPSGQATANALGVPVLTNAQLTSGLPADEVNLLNSGGGLLANKTPLWYYILRESAVIENGDRLGPLGAKIVADTFIKMLKRDKDSYLNASGGFTPHLLTSTNVFGEFNVEDIVLFSGVNEP